MTLCQTPAEALRVAASMWFDIIISDSGMPEADGYELLARLRQMSHLRDIPAAALTGYALQADAWLINRAELARRIEQLLRERRSSR